MAKSKKTLDTLVSDIYNKIKRNEDVPYESYNQYFGEDGMSKAEFTTNILEPFLQKHWTAEQFEETIGDDWDRVSDYGVVSVGNLEIGDEVKWEIRTGRGYWNSF